MLRAADISFGYGSTRAGGGDGGGRALVLDGVTVEVRRGEILGILGPNGSGKTTLLRILSGARPPSGGEVFLEEQPLHDLSRTAIARRIAVVPQETQLAYDYSVLEMVLMGRHPHLGLFELEGMKDIAIARDALRATGTATFETRQFNTLSGGEKQRVVIASALAQAADVLLLDEPTASLDLGYQLEVASLLTSLNRERGVTIVLSTHDLNLAAAICHQLVLLHRGRVLAMGPTDAVLTSAHIRELYGVTVDVHRHGISGHLVVVPIARESR